MQLEGSEDAELESPVPDSDGPESGPVVTPKKAKSKAAPKPSPSSSSKKVKPAKTAGGARHTSRPEGQKGLPSLRPPLGVGALSNQPVELHRL